MKPQTITLASLALLSVQTLSAHPGPAGHTHADDWPFGSIILVAFLLIAAYAIFKKSSKTN